VRFVFPEGDYIMSIRVRLDTRKLDGIAAGLEKNKDKALKTLAAEVKKEAKARAPVKSGALRDSIHYKKIESGLYSVQDEVEYGQFVELGTHKMAAQPFMAPAVEQVRALNIEIWRELFE
jgi:HK97 gp10 family phage protein